MEDKLIVDLYWARNEDAIAQTSVKYGRMMHSTSKSIVGNNEDAEECVNDAYLAAWNSMPQNRPTYLGGYMAKIIRNLSLNRYDHMHAAKRHGVQVVFEELEECLSDTRMPEEEYEAGCLRELLDGFLAGLDEEKRVVFLRRYFYTDSIAEIAERMQLSEGKVKTMLFRLRAQLAKELERAGV